MRISTSSYVPCRLVEESERYIMAVSYSTRKRSIVEFERAWQLRKLCSMKSSISEMPSPRASSNSVRLFPADPKFELARFEVSACEAGSNLCHQGELWSTPTSLIFACKSLSSVCRIKRQSLGVTRCIREFRLFCNRCAAL